MDERYFVMIRFPWGPKPMVTDNGDGDPSPPVTMFPDIHAAASVARASRAAIAYGAEIFQMGSGEEL